jgi:hypothetical protein
MSRFLRWGLALLLIAGLLIGTFLFLPFRSWLPGGTVGDLPKSEVVNGTAFNRLFPKAQVGETIVFTQEKRGFSEARLKSGAETREQGSQASALLVADRFQVKVIGQGAGLDQEQRHELLGAFDLAGLAALNPGSATIRTTSPTSALPPGQRQPVTLPTPVLEPAA